MVVQENFNTASGRKKNQYGGGAARMVFHFVFFAVLIRASHYGYICDNDNGIVSVSHTVLSFC